MDIGSPELLVAIAALAGSLGGAIVSVGVPSFFESRREKARGWLAVILLDFELSRLEEAYANFVDFHTGRDRNALPPDELPEASSVPTLETEYRDRLEDLARVLTLDDQAFVLRQFGHARFWNDPPASVWDVIDGLDAADNVATAIGRIRGRLRNRRDLSSVQWSVRHPRQARNARQTITSQDRAAP